MTSLAGTPPTADLSTVLALDVGSVATKASLFRRDEQDAWRLEAVAESFSTASSPREGILGGVATAARELEARTGRRLLSAHKELVVGGASGTGADALVGCSSAASPLRLSILAASDISGAQARRAAEWSYTSVEHHAVVAPSRGSVEERRWRSGHALNGPDLAAVLRVLEPDAILVVGGFEGGATAPALGTTELLAHSRPPNRPCPTVVYAGNSQAAAQVVKTLAGRADVRVVPNVLPYADCPRPQPAGEALDDLYCQRKLARLCGFDDITGSAAAPPLSTARALALAWAVLSNMWGSPVLGLDIGAQSTIVGRVEPTGAAQIMVRSDIGLRHGLAPLGPLLGGPIVERWLPLALSKTEVQTGLADIQEHPYAVPGGDDLLFQEAVAREVVRVVLHRQGVLAGQDTVADLAPLRIVASGGVVAHAPSPWRAALLLLDALQPLGIVSLWRDGAHALSGAGAFAGLDALAARSLFETSVLSHIGTAVCMAGQTAPGSKAAHVELRMASGSIRQTDIAWGSVYILRTDETGPATLSIRPMRGVYIPGREEEGVVTQDVQAGELGVILDCRGRPLSPETDKDRRAARVRAWLAADGG